MLLNVSRLSDQLRCEVYAHNKWRLGKAAVFENIAARAFGSAWHAGVEHLMKARAAGEPPLFEEAFQAGAPFFQEAYTSAPTEEKGRAVLTDSQVLEELLPRFEIPPSWVIRAVEQEMQLHMGTLPTTGEELTMRGRLDTVVEWEGLTWHVQHKTAGPSVSWPLFEAAIQRSFHENLYLEMLSLLVGEEKLGGTILLGVKRLSLKTAREEPASAFHRAFIPNNRADRARALSSIITMADRIAAQDALVAADIPLRLVENRDACYGVFKNMPCPFLKSCGGLVSIDDPAYYKDVDPLAAYATSTVVE